MAPGKKCYLVSIPFEIRDQILRDLLVCEDYMIKPFVLPSLYYQMRFSYAKELPEGIDRSFSLTFVDMHPKPLTSDIDNSSPAPSNTDNTSPATFKIKPSPAPSNIDNSPPATSISGALIRTCRQLHIEGTRLLYGANTFAFDCPDAPMILDQDDAGIFEVAKVFDQEALPNLANMKLRELLRGSIWRFINTIGRSNAALIQSVQYMASSIECDRFPCRDAADRLLFRHTLVGLRSLKVNWRKCYVERKDFFFRSIREKNDFIKAQYERIFLDHQRIVLGLVKSLPLLEEVVLYGPANRLERDSKFVVQLSETHESAKREVLEKVFGNDRCSEAVDWDRQELKEAFKLVLEAEVAEETVKIWRRITL